MVEDWPQYKETPIIPYHRPMVKYKDSHMLSNGPKVEALEKAIKELYDVEHVIACSSCSQGLLLIIGNIPDRLISTPAFTWECIGDILYLLSMEKEYIDIDSRTWNIKDQSYRNPIIANHTFGNIFQSFFSERVIYDGAHALGSNIKHFGIATVMSLAPTKLVTACEGGLILTNDNNLAEYLRTYRNRLSRMSEPNADIGLYTLESLDEILEWKKRLYHYYKRHLPGIFQEIPHSSNYNTIGMLTDLKIPPHIECRKYYQPLSFEEHLKVTKYVYNKMVCLPSWYGVDYEKIVNDIMDYNESLNNGRVRVFGYSIAPGSNIP